MCGMYNFSCSGIQSITSLPTGALCCIACNSAITDKIHKIHAFPAASGHSWSASQYVRWNTSNNDNQRKIIHLWVDEGCLEVTASLLSLCAPVCIQQGGIKTGNSSQTPAEVMTYSQRRLCEQREHAHTQTFLALSAWLYLWQRERGSEAQVRLLRWVGWCGLPGHVVMEAYEIRLCPSLFFPLIQSCKKYI